MNPVYAHKLKRAQVRAARRKSQAFEMARNALVPLLVVVLSFGALGLWLSLDAIAAALAGGAR